MEIMRGLLLLLCLAAADSYDTNLFDLVTYGSAVKLQHMATGQFLNSQGVNWGSGSGQQVITTIAASNEASSLWKIIEAHGGVGYKGGTPIKCGAVVRLVHSSTKKFLHSHNFPSPLSRQQEVSGYQGHDSGDNWRVDCEGRHWQRTQHVRFVHADSSKHLGSHHHQFNQQNCPNCPILGHGEVTGMAQADANTIWTTNLGVFMPRDEA